jgi:hypothetical protein
MIKLKTLKDLKTERIGFGVYPNIHTYKFFIDKEILKAEAIKWVKIFKFGTPYGAHPIDKKTVSWIKHFFNLTEEDIKNV